MCFNRLHFHFANDTPFPFVLSVKIFITRLHRILDRQSNFLNKKTQEGKGGKGRSKKKKRKTLVSTKTRNQFHARARFGQNYFREWTHIQIRARKDGTSFRKPFDFWTAYAVIMKRVPQCGHSSATCRKKMPPALPFGKIHCEEKEKTLYVFEKSIKKYFDQVGQNLN